MTNPQAPADEDLLASDYGDGTYDVTGDEYAEPEYDPADWDTFPVDEWDWDGPPADVVPPAKTPPWFRNPRLLFALIALAAAALVVATVLLITGRQSGEIPTTSQLTTAVTPTSPSVRSTPRAPKPATASTAPPSPSPEPAYPSVEEAPVPVEQQPVPSAAPEPSPSPSATQSRSPAGPKINVTRNPMSFAPEKH